MYVTIYIKRDNFLSVKISIQKVSCFSKERQAKQSDYMCICFILVHLFQRDIPKILYTVLL